jgi:hypothetical protein
VNGDNRAKAFGATSILALGLMSTIFIGAAGLVVTAVAVVALVVVRRRRRDLAAASGSDAVPVEMSRRAL